MSKTRLLCVSLTLSISATQAQTVPVPATPYPNERPATGAFADARGLTPPNVRRTGVVTVRPANGQDSTVESFRAFDINVSFAGSYCLDAAAPGYSSASLKNGTLRLLLSHQSTTACAPKSTHTIRLSGLPAADYSIYVGVTATLGAPFSPPVQFVELDSVEVESGMTNVTVRPKAGEVRLGMVTCGGTPGTNALARFEGGCISIQGEKVATDEASYASTGPRIGTFTAYRFETDPGAPYQRLYSIEYPTPFLGTFWTADSAVCRGLAAAWNKPTTECAGGTVYALSLKEQSCPLGASPIYQLFHPQAIAHRYTQSATLYRALIERGYRGEGAFWCAPLREW